jgi:mRNA-degrading endonuclease YafQ of YafQ-DinJ toxin-antitoxin module
MYSLVFPAFYRRRERVFLKRHPDFRERYLKTLLLLENDPFHPSLRLHPLRGRLQGLHSASITMRYRITLELEIRDKEILFVDIGGHGEVYR